MLLFFYEKNRREYHNTEVRNAGIECQIMKFRRRKDVKLR